MNLAPPSPAELIAHAQAEPDEETLAQVRKILADLRGLETPRRRPERRRTVRRHFPYLLEVTPLDSATGRTIGPADRGLGRQLSELGLDFYYPGALPQRHVLVSVEAGGSRLLLPLELTWCRFLHDGWFEHGGKFVPIEGIELA